MSSLRVKSGPAKELVIFNYILFPKYSIPTIFNPYKYSTTMDRELASQTTAPNAPEERADAYMTKNKSVPGAAGGKNVMDTQGMGSQQYGKCPKWLLQFDIACKKWSVNHKCLRC